MTAWTEKYRTRNQIVPRRFWRASRNGPADEVNLAVGHRVPCWAGGELATGAVASRMKPRANRRRLPGGGVSSCSGAAIQGTVPPRGWRFCSPPPLRRIGAVMPGRILGPRVRRPAPRIRVDGVPARGPLALRAGREDALQVLYREIEKRQTE